MSKARKSKAKTPSHTVPPVSPQPLRGIEKAAWWSVPAVGVIGLICASTIGVLFLKKPATVATNPAVKPPVKIESIDASKNQPQVTQTNRTPEPDSKPAPAAEPEFEIADLSTDENNQQIGEPIPFAEVIPEPTAVADTPAPKVVAPVSIEARTTMSLTCSQGKISFSGKQDLVFVETQPALEVIEEGDVKFAHLVFNGVDNSAELSPISRAKGSIEIVVLMPDRKTSVVLDTNFQRMTLRKNRDGLRWRIGGKQKPDKIRLVPNPVNFNQWHHVMITWKNGGDAILYLDGVEQDRYPYVHEQPHFGEFQKVVLGRTRGPNGRYYESRVNRLVVYDQPIAPEKVSELNQAVRQTYPFVFK